VWLPDGVDHGLTGTLKGVSSSYIG
jgi:hypothetical protein